MFITKALKSSWAISWVMTELKPTILDISSIFTISLWNGSVYINHGMVDTRKDFCIFSHQGSFESLFTSILHTKFHILSSSWPLVITYKMQGKWKFHMPATFWFTLYQKVILQQKLHIFQRPKTIFHFKSQYQSCGLDRTFKFQNTLYVKHEYLMNQKR